MMRCRDVEAKRVRAARATPKQLDRVKWRDASRAPPAAVFGMMRVKVVGDRHSPTWTRKPTLIRKTGPLDPRRGPGSKTGPSYPRHWPDHSFAEGPCEVDHQRLRRKPTSEDRADPKSALISTWDDVREMPTSQSLSNMSTAVGNEAGGNDFLGKKSCDSKPR